MVFPEKNNSSASATRPRCVACTGVPVVPGKSIPLWGDPGFPLRIRLFPKFEPVVTPSNGMRNLPSHKRSGVTRSKISRNFCRSSLARWICSGLGLTNSFPTCNFSVANKPFLTAPFTLGFVAVLPPKRDSPSAPLSLHFRHGLCAFQFDQQQTSLACFGCAQPQCCSRRADSRIFRDRSAWKHRGNHSRKQGCKSHMPHSENRILLHVHRSCRIAATRASTFSNCVRANFDPMMAFSIVRNSSGFFIFSRSSGKNGRTFAKIKYISPQNAT